jgi:hypothetical protein
VVESYCGTVVLFDIAGILSNSTGAAGMRKVDLRVGSASRRNKKATDDVNEDGRYRYYSRTPTNKFLTYAADTAHQKLVTENFAEIFFSKKSREIFLKMSYIKYWILIVMENPDSLRW